MKLLIVEDDLLLQEGLALGLANEGYALDCASTAAEADALIQSGEYSLVILDLGLPDKDGATLLTQWRRRGIANPVLILTARDAIEDRITGLDAGADDYLVKPFALAELQARVRALIRRYQGRRYHAESANPAGPAPVPAGRSHAQRVCSAYAPDYAQRTDGAP
mgnify:CR=1 FL=1